jgi:uncharacterized protein YjbI with pentapeptide repeats
MGICEDAPDEYCGHMLKREQKDIDSGLDVDEWNEKMNNAVCIREPAYSGRCVWHADTNEKTREELIAARLKPEDVPWETECVKEHLSGAILCDITLPKRGFFDKCTLISAEFRLVSFADVTFEHTNFERAKFVGADIRRTTFDNVNLVNAEFSDGKHRETKLLYTTEFHDTLLHSADLQNIILSGTEFRGGSLFRAKFDSARLQDVVFSDVELRGAEFPHANLSKVNFHNANNKFTESNFYRAEMEEVKFDGGSLPSAKFDSASLQDVVFSDVELRDAEFPHANLSRANFHNAKVTGANFYRAEMEEAEFTRTTLKESNLTGADLHDAIFSGSTLKDVEFKPSCALESLEHLNQTSNSADPLGASLEDAQLEDGTDLRGANLSGARLYQTAFRNVRINDETQFGIDDDNKPGKACRYEYDPNTDVSITDDVSRFRAAARTHRRLESLFEENAMDQRAQNAHIRKQEAQRKRERTQLNEGKFPSDSWLESFREFGVKTVNWHLHRHGESLRQLLTMSGILIFFCGIGYSLGGIAQSNPNITYRLTIADFTKPWAVPIDLLNGLYFSIITFSTIGYGDFYPSSTLSRLLVGIESLFGALFIALFVFVIGRRVAR